MFPAPGWGEGVAFKISSDGDSGFEIFDSGIFLGPVGKVGKDVLCGFKRGFK